MERLPYHTTRTHLGHLKLATIHWFLPQTTAPKECRGTSTSTMVLSYMGPRASGWVSTNRHYNPSRTCKTSHNTLIFAPNYCPQGVQRDLNKDDGVILHVPWTPIMGRLSIHTTRTHLGHVKLARIHWFFHKPLPARSVVGPQHRRWCYFTWALELPDRESTNPHHYNRSRTCKTSHNT